MAAKLAVSLVDHAAITAQRGSSPLSPPVNGQLTAVVLHGLFGSSRNWAAYCRALVRKQPNWRFLLVDLPGHGHHPHESMAFSRPVSVPSAASDVVDALSDSPALPNGWGDVQAVVGHSMGGRIALEMLASHASALAPGTHVATLDSMPGDFTYAKHDSDPNGIERVLQFLRDQPRIMPSRQWMQEQCAKAGFSKGIASWMGTNVRSSEDGEGVQWAFHVPTAEALYTSHQSFSHWDTVHSPPSHVHLHFVMATGSSRWGEQGTAGRVAKARSLAPSNLHLHSIDAGHWVHVDNPRGLSRLLQEHVLLAGTVKQV